MNKTINPVDKTIIQVCNFKSLLAVHSRSRYDKRTFV